MFLFKDCRILLGGGLNKKLWDIEEDQEDDKR
jgi:hypothetical protein